MMAKIFRKTQFIFIFLSMNSALWGQNLPRKIEIHPTWTPYEWSMMPADDFFKVTGLLESDSIEYRTYRLGLDTMGSVKIRIDYIPETNSDVVGYIKYENWKVKDIFKINELVEAKYNIRYGEDDEKPDFWLGNALVELGYMRTNSNPKRGHYDLLSNPVYRFIPHPKHILDKLDSTWSQLINNPTDRMRGILNDSEAYRVTIRNVTPMVEYELVYPLDIKTDSAIAMTSLNFPGGLDALKWSMKQHYTEYLDHMEDGEIWFVPTDRPTVPIAYFFNTGVILHTSISQSEFLEWVTYEEEADE